MLVGAGGRAEEQGGLVGVATTRRNHQQEERGRAASCFSTIVVSRLLSPLFGVRLIGVRPSSRAAAPAATGPPDAQQESDEGPLILWSDD